MPSFNKVIIMGNLTRDPEVRYLPNGTAVANFAIAINERWKNDQGQEQERVTFIECTAWGRTAETIGQYLTKGKPIHIDGKLRLETWDDKETGAKRSKIVVVVNTFQFIGGREDSEDRGEAVRRDGPAPRPTRAPRAAAPAADPDMPPVEDDDVPF